MYVGRDLKDLSVDQSDFSEWLHSRKSDVSFFVHAADCQRRRDMMGNAEWQR